MRDDFTLLRVGEVASSISETHKRDSEQLIFLNTSDIFHGKFLHSDYSNVREWPGQAKKSIRKDDILFSEIRPANGRWAYVDRVADDYVVSTKLMVIRARPEVILPKYLYLFLTSDATTAWLQSLAESRSGTFPQITFDQVAALEIEVPSLGTQSRVVGMVAALDDKIESDLVAQAACRQLVAALYAAAAQSADGAVMQLGSVMKEQRVKVGRGEDGSAVVLSAVASGHLRPSDEFFNKQVYSKSIANYLRVPPGALAYNPSRANIGSIGIHDGDAMGAVSPIYVVASIEDRWHDWVRTSLRTQAVMEQVRTLSSGSVRQSIRYADFASIEVPMPTPEELAAFTAVATALRNRETGLEAEIARLTEVRNALLPELMAGRIRVSEVAEALA